MKKELKPRRVFINPIYKDKVTILKSSSDTGGIYSLAELEVSPGGGNSLHVHSAFDETFTAVKGILGVVLKGKRIFLQPGESVTVTKYTPHHFFNNSNQTVVCRLKFTPGHEGFEKGLAIAYGLASDGKTTRKGIPRSIHHLALLVNLTNSNPAGFMGMLTPVFSWLANRARKNGTEKALLMKYYYQGA
jgi:mannose-6-phosphate isomerase-like protein (cupin superfamily)